MQTVCAHCGKPAAGGRTVVLTGPWSGRKVPLCEKHCLEADAEAARKEAARKSKRMAG